MALSVILKSVICVLAVGALAGCVGTGDSLGPVSGLTPVVGQAANSAALIASLQGGLIGRAEGVSISQRDNALALQSEYRALEYTAPSQPVYWQSENGRLTGTVIPSQPYRVGSQDCRQYAHLVTLRGATVEENGTACRNEDGSWSLLS